MASSVGVVEKVRIGRQAGRDSAPHANAAVDESKLQLRRTKRTWLITSAVRSLRPFPSGRRTDQATPTSDEGSDAAVRVRPTYHVWSARSFARSPLFSEQGRQTDPSVPDRPTDRLCERARASVRDVVFVFFVGPHPAYSCLTHCAMTLPTR